MHSSGATVLQTVLQKLLNQASCHDTHQLLMDGDMFRLSQSFAAFLDVFSHRSGPSVGCVHG